MKLIAAYLIAGAVLLGTVPKADATLIAWGDPVIAHSWDQTFSANSAAPFDALAIKVTNPAGATFENDGFFNLPGGWTSVISMDSKTITASSAADTMSLTFGIHFNGLPTDYLLPGEELLLEFSFLNNGAEVFFVNADFDGVDWNTAAPNGALAVPDGGSTLLLLGLSFLGLGLAYFRKGRRSASQP